MKLSGSIAFSGLRFECGKQEGVRSKEVRGTVLANPEITLPSPISSTFMRIGVATKSLSFTFTVRYVSNRFFGMGVIIKPNRECIRQYSQSSLVSCVSSPQQDPEMLGQSGQKQRTNKFTVDQPLGHCSNMDVIMSEGPLSSKRVNAFSQLLSDN